MAEETKNPETVVAVAEETKNPETVVAVADKTKNPETVVAAEKQEEVVVSETEKTVDEVGPEKITQSASFKEESNVVAELPEFQRKALDELKKLIQDSLARRDFSAPPPPPPVTPLPVPVKEVVVAEKKEEEQTPVDEVAPPPATTAADVQSEASAAVVEPPAKTEEKTTATDSESVAVVEPPAKIEEEAPATEEEKEKTVEDIKETIVEEVAVTSADVPLPKEVEPEAGPVPVPETEKAETTKTAPASEPVEPEEVSIWGIPLLADDRTDVILLKFLRARDFKVKEAFTMIRNTVRWRKEFGVDELLVEDLGKDYEKVLFTHGYDKEGRIVCYNVFGEFQNKELYQNTFSDAEKRKKFLKWLIQFLEKIIRDLDFNPKGINSIVLVNDLKNSPGYGKRDVSKIIDKFLVILQDNYPEFVAKQLCINTSWWYVAYYWIYLTVFTPRSKSKFVFASPSKTPETLFKYIAPEHVPIQYGGHSKIGETEFSPADPVTEVIIKAGTKHPIEFAFSEAAVLVWELRVIGWDVNYGAEFLPSKEGGYTLNISKPKKVASSTDEPVISDSFKVTEAGKVVITIDNQSSKKKKLLYRSKVKASSE